MKEEKVLNNMFGKENHFTVPEGYFDSFAVHLMGQLPVAEARVIEMHAQPWWHRLPMRKVAAAVGVAVVLGGSGLFYASHRMQGYVPMASTHVEQQEGGSSDYGTFDQMADYTMMDNETIYASLVAENQASDL